MTSVEPRRDARDRLRADLRATLPVYEPIEPADVLAARLGIDAARIVKLDGNENPYGPSDRAVEALRGAARDYAIYPDPEQRALREAIGRALGVGAAHVVAGAGSDELIDLLIRLFVAPGDAVVTCSPTFGMYRFSTMVQGGRVVDVPRDERFAVDAAAVAGTVAREHAKVIFLASPNNPTGNLLAPEQLDTLLATDALVVLDEAYVEFANTGGFAGRVAEGAKNLVVLRTFSKWAGLAGLRVGYAVAAPDIAGLLMTVKPPYTPNVAGAIAALASLEDTAALMDRVRLIVAETVRLSAALAAIAGTTVYPTNANFVLVRLPDHIDAVAVRDELRMRGVFVRYFSAPAIDDCLRISAGTPDQNDAVVAALREVLHARS